MSNSKHKLLIVNSHLKIGGIERALVSLLQNLDYSKYEVDLLLLSDEDNLSLELPTTVNVIKRNLTESFGRLSSVCINAIKRRNYFAINFRIRLIISRISNNLAYKRLYRSLGISKKYDSAIAFRPDLCADIIAHAVKSTNKVCWWHHGSIDVGLSLHLLKQKINSFNRIITVSIGMKNILKEYFKDKEIRVIPNILDIPLTLSKASEYNPYKDKDTIKIVSVGRLSIEKNYEEAIEIAKILTQKKFAFEWHIIGEGEVRESLTRLINDNNLQACVYLEGNQKNPYPWIKYADVMIHTSKIESLGLVILESMALRTPCIVAESVGPSGFMREDNGYLVPHNPHIMAEKVIELVNSAQTKELMINNAFLTAETFNSKSVIKTFEQIF